MKTIKSVGWKIALLLALVMAASSNLALAQEAALERLFMGGGYDDDIQPAGEKAKGAAAEDMESVEVTEPASEAGKGGLKPMDLIMGRDITSDTLTDEFFKDPDKREPVTYPQMYETAGYLSGLIISEGEVIDGEPSNQASFSIEEFIYINQGEIHGVGVGSQFIVFHPQRPNVIHPVTGSDMGFKVLVDGVIEVVEVNMDIAKAKIIRSYDGIERGDNIRLYTQVKVPSFDPDRPVPAKEIDGYVLVSRDPKEGFAMHDIVYFDVGSVSGVEPGDVFDIIDSRFVVRKDGKRVEGLPKLIGKATIISARDNTSTGLITKSDNVIYAGDKITYSRTR